jgi:hypothetical protein
MKKVFIYNLNGQANRRAEGASGLSERLDLETFVVPDRAAELVARASPPTKEGYPGP